MSKRSHENKVERWRRKLKKYEEKLEQGIRCGINSDEYENPQEHLENELDQPVSYSLPAESECVLQSQDLPNEVCKMTSVDAEAGASLTQTDPATPMDETDESDNFDPLLVKALGEADVDIIEYGSDLQADLAIRFQKILLCGLRKETKEEILKKHLFPKNVPFTKGPTLNPEIGVMLADTCRIRDKRLLVKQDQLGKALSALGKAITCLLKKSPDIPDIIRTLNDAGQLLADSHYTETDTRRSVIIPLIDKSLTGPFKDRKRDSLLFGENLGDLVKNSRGITKTSQLIQAHNSSSVNLNGKGPSTKVRYQHQRSGQMYPPRAGGPRATTSYAHYAYPSRKRASALPLPPVRRPPPPPRRPRQPPLPQPRGPRYTAPH